MRRLFLFIYKYRALLFFLLLQVVCGWLIITNNTYHSAAFYNSSNRVAGSIHAFTEGVRAYFMLSQENSQLVEENARLREQLERNRQSLLLSGSDLPKPHYVLNQYQYIPAKVIKNTTTLTENFITINRGRLHGIAPNQGVIGPDGIVGKVKAVSENFATVVSVLHKDMRVSSALLPTNTVGTTAWRTGNATEAAVLYVPRHVEVAKGDSVVTSGYNAVFPFGIPLGKVSKVGIEPSAKFYDIELDLATDFYSLAYVYVVQSRLEAEKDSLQLGL